MAGNWTCLPGLGNESPASWIASRPEWRQQLLGKLTPEETAALEFDWSFWARPDQREPAGEWLYWNALAGRGWGKTRVGAECVRGWVESGRYKRIALIAPTSKDLRDVMIEGESGLLSICPPWFYPKYEPTKKKLTWPNGAVAIGYSAEEPKRLRGPQHDAGWADEMYAAWDKLDAWDMFLFGLRLGLAPRVCITSTPRPIELLRQMLKDPDAVVTRGSTYANKANLAAKFFEKVIKAYEGTRLGRQELMAELLDDVPGALWTRAILDAARVRTAPDLFRVVIAVDPAVSSKPDSDETGIIAAGLGVDAYGYVLGDYSCIGTPAQWAQRAVNAWRHHRADCIVAEANQGGEMVAATIAAVDPLVPVQLVHASRGKVIRAEPIAALYEQLRVKHVWPGQADPDEGTLERLEDQLVTWSPHTMESSPDRLDALVWGLTELFYPGERQLTIGFEERVSISDY